MSYFDQLTDHTKIAAVFLYMKQNRLHFDLSDLDSYKLAVSDVLNHSLPNLVDHFRIERPKTFDKIEALNKTITDFIPDLEFLFNVITVSNFLILIRQQQIESNSLNILDASSLARNAIKTTLDLFEFALTSSDQIYLSRDIFKKHISTYAEPFFKTTIATTTPLMDSTNKIKKLGTWLLVKALPLKPN